MLKGKRPLFWILLFLPLIFFSVLGAISLGTVSIPYGETLEILKGFLMGRGGESALNPSHVSIIWEIRFPRVVLALFVGASLATAGVALQGLLRNPLADPYIVGTSAGAALGAAVSMILGWKTGWLGWSLLPVMAFLGSFLTMLVVFFLARVGGRLPVATFLLAGVIVGSFIWASVTFLLTMAREDLARIFFWLMGTFSDRTWKEVWIVIPYFLIGFTILLFLAYPLNLLTLGEEKASPLGVEVEKIKIWILLAATLVTSASVAVSGLIGFIGLIVPHAVRILVGPDHRLLLPGSALAGGVFLVWADTAARLVAQPAEIPVGVITALLGAPFFCYLLRKAREASQ